MAALLPAMQSPLLLGPGTEREALPRAHSLAASRPFFHAALLTDSQCQTPLMAPTLTSLSQAKEA